MVAVCALAASAAQAAGVPRPGHVVGGMGAGRTYEDVLGTGAAAAPFINGLAAQGTKFTNSTTPPGLHPDQPNYIALLAGDNLGVTDNNCLTFTDTSNLVAQLLAAGRTFTGYSEGLPAEGATDC